jgi:hypothetical protein
MRTVTAKQFSNVPTWQQDQQAKQAKKAAKQQRDQRKGKHNFWSNAE